MEITSWEKKGDARSSFRLLFPIKKYPNPMYTVTCSPSLNASFVGSSIK